MGKTLQSCISQWTRRDALLASVAAAFALGAGIPRRAYALPGDGYRLRRVGPADGDAVSQLMTSCVSSGDSFHGKCDPWSVRWADVTIQRRPESLVLERSGEVLGFVEIPNPRPEPVAPGMNAEAAERARYARQLRVSRTFQLKAAGIQSDRLTGRDAVDSFVLLLVLGAERALDLGFDHAECLLPWAKHPKFEKSWSRLGGREVEPASRDQVTGQLTHQFRFDLARVVDELRTEVGGFGDVEIDL